MPDNQILLYRIFEYVLKPPFVLEYGDERVALNSHEVRVGTVSTINNFLLDWPTSQNLIEKCKTIFSIEEITLSEVEIIAKYLYLWCQDNFSNKIDHVYLWYYEYGDDVVYPKPTEL